MTYYFSMLRFVPDPARGEFINLGAIVGDDESQDWELRLLSNPKRARAIDANGLLPGALQFVGALEDRLPTEDAPEASDVLTVEALSSLAGEMNNLVQLTVPAPVFAASAEQALDIVFDDLVLDPAAQRFRFEKKHRAVKATRQAYRSHEVPDNAIKERVRVIAGMFSGQFDFAVHNGEAVQLVQCWSFQLPNQQELAEQVKAWAWVVHELREGGGRVITDTLEIRAPRELEIAAVYIPPEREHDAPAFDEARAAFEETGVNDYTPETAADLGERAAAALHVSA